MAEKAAAWIAAALAAWKAIVGIAFFLVLCGAGYASVQITLSAHERRIEKLEENDDLILNKVVEGLEKLDHAQREASALEKQDTDDYRDEMRERTRNVESAVVGLQRSFEQIEKRLE